MWGRIILYNLVLWRGERNIDLFECNDLHTTDHKCEAILFAIASIRAIFCHGGHVSNKVEPPNCPRCHYDLFSPSRLQKFISRMPNLGLHDTANNSAHPIALHSFLYICPWCCHSAVTLRPVRVPAIHELIDWCIKIEFEFTTLVNGACNKSELYHQSCVVLSSFTNRRLQSSKRCIKCTSSTTWKAIPAIIIEAAATRIGWYYFHLR